MNQKIKPVYVSSSIHGNLAQLVGNKKSVGLRASMKDEAEIAIKNHISQESGGVKKGKIA